MKSEYVDARTIHHSFQEEGMTLKPRRYRIALCAAMLAFVGLTACNPIDRLADLINKTIAQVFGTSPNSPGVDCSVIIFDQQVDSRLSTFFKPVSYPPQSWPLWTQACLTGPTHSVPTFKASGQPNTPNPNKHAVCWARGYVPGDPGLRCSFDYEIRFFWVSSLSTSGDGHMVVGALTV